MTVTELQLDPKVSSSEHASAPTPIEAVVCASDHTTVGRVLVGGGLLSMVLAFALTAVYGFDAGSGGKILDAGFNARIWLNHPLGLSIAGAIPIVLGAAALMIPRQLSSGTLAFPRASAFGAWSWVLGALLFWVAVFANGSYGGENDKLAMLGHVSVAMMAFALSVVAATVATSVLTLRPAGMKLSSVGFFSYASLVFSIVVLATLGTLLAQLFAWYLIDPAATDLKTEVYPNLEWLFRAPTVAMFCIPLLGVLADAASAAAGSRVRGHGFVNGFIGLAGLVSIGSWAITPGSRETVVWTAVVIVSAIPLIGVAGLSAEHLRREGASPTPALAVALSGVVAAMLSSLVGVFMAINSVGDGDQSQVLVGGFSNQTDELAKVATKAGPGLVVGEFYGAIGVAALAVVAALVLWGRSTHHNEVDRSAKFLAPIGMLGVAALMVPQVAIGTAMPDSGVVKVMWVVGGVGAVLLGLIGLQVAVASLVPSEDSDHQEAM